jgi:Txe/YoeB family toxin of Txe-Axe toxin-antitoxin module
MAADWREGDPPHRVYFDNCYLINKFTREELEALDDDDLEHIEKFEGPFAGIWSREVNESGRFNLMVQMTDAEIRDAAHDCATRLKYAAGKIDSAHHPNTGFPGSTRWFSCRECEDSFPFQGIHAADIVSHVMRQHPPTPLVKSAIKC